MQVAAAGVNRPDVLQRRGGYPPPPGRVGPARARDRRPRRRAGPAARRRADALARGRRRVRAGRRRRLRRVLRGAGGAVPAGAGGAARWSRRRHCPRPSSRCGPTCSSAAGCRPGESMLVHGGIQRHRHHRDSAGAGVRRPRVRHRRVGGQVRGVRAARRRDRRELPRAATGCAVLREATGGRGVDVILDMVGGDYVPAICRCSPSRAGWCRLRSSSRRVVELDLMQVMRRRLTITGSTLRPRTPAEKGAIAAALEAQVWPLLAAGHRPAGDPRRVPAGPGRRRAPDDGGERSTSARSCWT